MTDARATQAAERLLAALAQPVRWRIMVLLREESACVHQLVDELSLPQPLVSQHLRVLREAHLVDRQQVGREAHYRVADEHVGHLVDDILAHAGEDHPAVEDHPATEDVHQPRP